MSFELDSLSFILFQLIERNSMVFFGATVAAFSIEGMCETKDLNETKNWSKFPIEIIGTSIIL